MHERMRLVQQVSVKVTFKCACRVGHTVTPLSNSIGIYRSWRRPLALDGPSVSLSRALSVSSSFPQAVRYFSRTWQALLSGLNVVHFSLHSLSNLSISINQERERKQNGREEKQMIRKDRQFHRWIVNLTERHVLPVLAPAKHCSTNPQFCPSCMADVVSFISKYFNWHDTVFNSFF